MHGFCREVQKLLHDKIIPNDVIHLCVAYSLLQNLMFYLYPIKQSDKIQKVDVKNLENNLIYNSNIISSNDKIEKIDTNTAGVGFHSSLPLPPSIEKQFFGIIIIKNIHQYLLVVEHLKTIHIY